MKQAIGRARAGGMVFLIALCALLSPSFQDKPRESVTVTAVEVPVRVFDKNGFITGLIKDDFEIFENGVRQEITGFESISRTITPVPVTLPEAIPQAPRKRNFLLIFNVFDYTDQVGEAIDYFFKNVYAENDRIAVIVEEKILDIEKGESVEATVARLKDTLKRYKRISRFEISRVFMDLDKKAEDAARGGDEGRSYETTLSGFLEYYQRAWEDYRKRLLDVDLDLYRSVVRKLDRLDGDKWAICFQQRDLFPRLKSLGALDRAVSEATDESITGMANSHSRTIYQRRLKLEQSFDITRSFPADKLRTLFTEANITFHVLIMKSLNPGGFSQNLELRDVRADYEDVLRRISRATGGLTIFSNKALDTLKAAAAKEDRYYLLVYQPKDKTPRKEREIGVKVRRKGAEVVALKKFVGQKPPAISITGFGLEGKRVSFDIGNCGRLEQGGRNTGKVLAKVTLFDDQSAKVFNEMKPLDLIADSIHLSLNFEKLAPGGYFLIIEAADLVTGDKDVFSRAVVFE
jgi:VWFA-related protein